MPDSTFAIPTQTAGTLRIVLRPRGGDWLDADLREWKRMGITTIVSLLTADEIDDLALVHEADVVESLGMEFLRLPIPDRGIPSAEPFAADLIDTIVDRLNRGQSLAIHCRQGLGRAPLIAAAVLIRLGLTTSEAIARVAAARGRPIPETEPQLRWLVSFAERSSGVPAPL
jgi:protein-tyrosine phosphatase